MYSTWRHTTFLRVPIKRPGHNVNVSLVGLLLSQAESTITKEVPKLKVSFSLSKMSACKNQSQF